MSLPEVLLWRELRRRPGGFKFRRQHPAGAFILDFVCLEARLAIEIDGRAHDNAHAVAYDQGRDEWLANEGFLTLRIAAADVLSDLDRAVSLVTVRCAAEQPLHRRSGGPPPRSGEDLS